MSVYSIQFFVCCIIIIFLYIYHVLVNKDDYMVLIMGMYPYLLSTAVICFLGLLRRVQLLVGHRVININCLSFRYNICILANYILINNGVRMDDSDLEKNRCFDVIEFDDDDVKYCIMRHTLALLLRVLCDCVGGPMRLTATGTDLIVGQRAC